MYKQYYRYKILLMVSDVVITILVLMLMTKLRPILPGRFLDPGEIVADDMVYVMVAVLWHALFAMSGVYELRLMPNLSQQVSRFSITYVFAVLMLAGFLFFSFRDTSRMLIIYFSIADYISLIILRISVSYYIRHGKVPAASALIVGCSDNARELAETITGEHSSTINLVGFVDRIQPGEPLPAPYIGSIEDAVEIVKKYGIDLILIALGPGRFQESQDLVLALESLPVRVYVVPDTLSLALLNAETETFGKLVVIGIREPLIQGHRRVSKRLLDLVISTAVILVAWPVMVLIWIAIKLDSSGPGLFIAERVGQNGKIFKMYKFRTMAVDAEQAQEEVVRPDDQGRRIYKVKNDPRVTRVGKLLRRASLDELPQLLNVLKGEMSLVGPRPEQPFITKTYEHWQWERLVVPPGVTGWWQISGRSNLPMHLNTQYDIFYVRNYSILLDLKILIRTVGAVLAGRGAY